MEIGSGVDHQGEWIDGACLAESNLYAICEMSGSIPPTPTTTPTPSPSPTPSCPAGWDEYEESCYRAMEGIMTWDEAEAVCVAEEVSNTGCALIGGASSLILVLYGIRAVLKDPFRAWKPS